MQAALPNETRRQTLERLATHVLKFSAVLLAGYFVCCVVAVVLFERAYREGPGGPGIFESLIVIASLIVVVGILPIGLTVITASILSVLMRNRSWLAHLGAGMAASLPVAFS